MFDPEYTPEAGERALREINSKKRTTIDRLLLGVLISVLLAGVLSVFLGVYALASLVV